MFCRNKIYKGYMMNFMQALQDAEDLLCETPAVILPRDHKAYGVLMAVMLYKNQHFLQANESVYAVYLTDTELVFYTYQETPAPTVPQYTEVCIHRHELEAIGEKIVAFCDALDVLKRT